MINISRGRRLWRWIFWTIGGLALLVAVGFAFLVTVGMHERAKNAAVRASTVMASSIATDPVTVTMGQVALRIPRNYFVAMPNHDIQGRPDGLDFILLGLMPDFEPRTDANRAEFADFHGFGRKLDVLVSYKGYTRTGMDLFHIFYDNLVDSSVHNIEFDYHSFSAGGFEYMFHGNIDNPVDFIHCNPWGFPYLALFYYLLVI